MTDANIAVSFTASVGDLVAGVGDAKDALASLSEPFAQLNGQYAALGASIGEAFAPTRLQAFDGALNDFGVAREDARRRACADRRGDPHERRGHIRRRDPKRETGDFRRDQGGRRRPQADARGLCGRGAAAPDHPDAEGRAGRARRSTRNSPRRSRRCSARPGSALSRWRKSSASTTKYSTPSDEIRTR